MSRLTEMPQDGTPVHFCPVCSATYTTQREALGCVKRYTKALKYKPGDILWRHDGYGWHDGLPHWHREYPDEFQGREMKLLGFFWVVTAITPRIVVDRGATGRYFNARPQDAHELVLHVHSLGICNGMEGGRRGWASANQFEVVEVPAKVRREAKPLVGPIHTKMLF